MINSTSSAAVALESEVELASSTGVITAQPTGDAPAIQAGTGTDDRNQITPVNCCCCLIYGCCQALALASAGFAVVGHIAVPICVCAHAPPVVIAAGSGLTIGGCCFATCWKACCD